MVIINPIRDTVLCGNQEAYDIFGTVSGLLCAVTAPAAMGIKGVQGIGGVTSYARAIGTQYAKAAISAGAGYLGNEAGEAMGLPKWASFLMGVGVGTAAGFGTEALDRSFNISGYHINSYGELMTPEDAARYNQYWDEVESGTHVPPGMEAVDSIEGGSQPGWKLGDDINALTNQGKYPSWSTVKSRYWKNEANSAEEGEYSAENLARMTKGTAPLHDEIGVPKELHHVNGRDGVDPHNIENLKEVWPWEHSDIDPFRHYTGTRP